MAYQDIDKRRTCLDKQSKNGKLRRQRCKQIGQCLVCKQESIYKNHCSQCYLRKKARESGFNMDRAIRKLELQDYRCYYSGLKIDHTNASPDHTIPKSKDGHDSIENLRWVHWNINQMKRSLDEKVFMDLCKKVYRNGLADT